jgi:hypothetical protein
VILTQTDSGTDQLLMAAVEQAKSLRPQLRAGFQSRAYVRLQVEGIEEMALIELPEHGVPRFQFDRSGNPLSVALAVNSILLSVKEPVSAFLWWFTENSLLIEGARPRPVDLIGQRYDRHNLALINVAAEHGSSTN